MKLLLLSKKFPYPLKDGESIAVNNLCQALKSLGCNITILVMNTSKQPIEWNTLPKDYSLFDAIHEVKIDNRIIPKEAFLNLFSNESYHISRFVSKAYAQKLKELLSKESFDVVQLETLYLAPYVETIRANSKAIVSLRSHNVEYEIWERITKNTKNPLKKIYLGLLSKRLKRFELQMLNNYNCLVAITKRDLAHFVEQGCQIPGLALPIGVDFKRYENFVSVESTLNSFGFIGSLDWMPNLEGVDWLLANVWPTVNRSAPKAVLSIAGRNCPEYLRQKTIPGVQILGEVEDALQFAAEQGVMLVPLFSGSGMRVKILEAMALGRVVITTSMGLEGIEGIHKENVLIADTKELFVKQILFCLENKHELARIGRNAQTFIRDSYDNNRIAERLLKFYKELQLTNGDKLN